MDRLMKRVFTVVVGLMAVVGAQASEVKDSRFVCQKSFLDSYYFGTQFGDAQDTQLPGASRLVLNMTTQVPVDLIVIPEANNKGYYVFGANGARAYFPRPLLWQGAHFYRLALTAKRFVYVNEENGNLLSLATEPHNVSPLSAKTYTIVRPTDLDASEFDTVLATETKLLIENACQHFSNTVNEYASYNTRSPGLVEEYRARVFGNVIKMFSDCAKAELDDSTRIAIIKKLNSCKAFKPFLGRR